MALSVVESLLYDPGFVSDSSSTHKGIQRFLVTSDPPCDFPSYLHIFALTVPLPAGPSVHSFSSSKSVYPFSPMHGFLSPWRQTQL